MNALAVYLIKLFAPVLVEAIMALIRSLESTGNKTDTALGVATDIVRGLDASEVPKDERHARAHAAIAAYLRHESGEEPSSVAVNTLLELGLGRVRNAPAR